MIKEKLNKLNEEQLRAFFILYDKEELIKILLDTFNNKGLLNKLIEREITC